MEKCFKTVVLLNEPVSFKSPLPDGGNDKGARCGYPMRVFDEGPDRILDESPDRGARWGVR